MSRVAVEHVGLLKQGVKVVLLRDRERPVDSISSDVETEEVGSRTTIRALKFRVELLLEFVKFRSVVATDELIVDMNGDEDDAVGLFAQVEARVRLHWSKSLLL